MSIELALRNKRYTKEQWESNNPVLEDGELGFELSSLKNEKSENIDALFYKIGDGSSNWNDMPYVNCYSSYKLMIARKLGKSYFDGTKDLTAEEIGFVPYDGGVYSGTVYFSKTRNAGNYYINNEGKAVFNTLDVTGTVNLRNSLTVEDISTFKKDVTNYLTTYFGSDKAHYIDNTGSGKLGAVEFDGKVSITETSVDSFKTSGGGEFAKEVVIKSVTDTDLNVESAGALRIYGGVGIGKRLYVKGDTILNSTLEVTNKATLKDNLEVQKAATIGDTLGVGTNLTVGGNTSITGNTTIGSDLEVTGVSTFINDIKSKETIYFGNTFDKSNVNVKYIDKTGSGKLGTVEFTGMVTLASDPTNNLHAVTKQYVDNEIETKLKEFGSLNLKGTIGTNGDPGTVPTTNVIKGDCYKIVSSGTYAGLDCKTGDLIIARKSGNVEATSANWMLVPCGIEGETYLKYSTTEAANIGTTFSDGEITLTEAVTYHVINNTISSATALTGVGKLITDNSLLSHLAKMDYMPKTGGTFTGDVTIGSTAANKNLIIHGNISLDNSNNITIGGTDTENVNIFGTVKRAKYDHKGNEFYTSYGGKLYITETQVGLYAKDGTTSLGLITIPYATLSNKTDNVKISNSSSSSSTIYYPTFITGDDYQSVYRNLNYSLSQLDGTTTANGYSILSLGNNTVAGSSGNNYGMIRLFSINTGYANIRYASNTGNTTAWIPNTGDDSTFIMHNGEQTITGNKIIDNSAYLYFGSSKSYYTDGTGYANLSKLCINSTSTFNGDVTDKANHYFAGGTTYYINSYGDAKLKEIISEYIDNSGNLNTGNTFINGHLYIHSNNYPGNIHGNNAAGVNRYQLYTNSTDGSAADVSLIVAKDDNVTGYAYYIFGKNGTFTANALVANTGYSLITNIFNTSALSTLEIANSTGSSAALLLSRSSNADWRIINDAHLHIQNNYTSSKVDWFDVLTLNYNTGNATLKGALSIGGNQTIAGNLEVTGTSTFNGNVTDKANHYFANGTTYYVNSSGSAKFKSLTVDDGNAEVKGYILTNNRLYIQSNNYPGSITANNASGNKRYELYTSSTDGTASNVYLDVYYDNSGNLNRYIFGNDGYFTTKYINITEYLRYSSNTYPGYILATNTSGNKRYELYTNSGDGSVADVHLDVYNDNGYARYIFGIYGRFTTPLAHISNDAETSSSTEGALTVAGGVGIAKSLNIGKSLNVTESSTFNGSVTFSSAPYYKGPTSKWVPIWIYGDDETGAGVVMGAGGCTIIGAGESATELTSYYGAPEEFMVVSSDSNIQFIAGMQNGVNESRAMILDESLYLYPIPNHLGTASRSNTSSLGTSTYYWNSSYINTMNSNTMNSQELYFTRENHPNITFRNASGYRNTITQYTAGNEALVFATTYALASFMFVNGEDSHSYTNTDRWQSLTPGLQIKNNCVSIGKLIGNDITPTYKLHVEGNTNITGVFYINDRAAIRAIDSSWLRINDLSSYTSGIYFGNSIVRSDNRLECGSNGESFSADNSTGNVTVKNDTSSKTFTIGGGCTLKYEDDAVSFVFN